jgi:modulator of FtsH protease HflK
MANKQYYTENPPSVRIIRAYVGWIRTHSISSLLLLSVTILMAWLLSGIYTVRVEETAALLRFGHLIDDTIAPGLHLRLPWGIDTVTKLMTSEIHRLEIRGEANKEISLLTGDENLIDITPVVQYKSGRLSEFLFNSESPTLLLELSVRAALLEVVSAMKVDDVLTTGKTEIQNHVRKSAQAILDSYQAGVTIIAINLQSVNPPNEASAAFRKVNDSKAEASRALNSAESARDKSINLARGEASRTEQEANAAASSRIDRASGAANRFLSILAQEKITPKLTETELFINTISQVLSKAKLVILTPGQKSRVDVNLIEKTPEVEASPAAPELKMPQKTNLSIE